jgi:REP element-mobilizing transposase RayT
LDERVAARRWGRQAGGMGAIPRRQDAGIYHVATRSIAEEHIYRVAEDFVDFLNVLAPIEWTCHAFCVMPTHYHVLATTDEDGVLARAVHRLNRRYATRFNRRHGRRGHVFDSPYASVPVTSDSHLIWLTRYIAQNPSAPRTWPWSSFNRDFTFVDDELLVEIFGGRDRLQRYVFETLEPGSNQVRTRFEGVPSGEGPDPG